MAGYNGYQYETSPRKIRPEYEPRKTSAKKRASNVNKAKKVTKNTANKKVKKAKYNYKPVVYIMLGFAMLFTISYRYSLINEKYNQKENIKLQVSAVQKQNEQLKVSIENSLNLNSVEKSAEEKDYKKDNAEDVFAAFDKMLSSIINKAEEDAKSIIKKW